MAARFSVELFAKIVVASWLLAQAIIWIFEIRQQGWRSWLQTSMRLSYLQYLNARTGRQWLQIGTWFLAIFHVLLVMLCL